MCPGSVRVTAMIKRAILAVRRIFLIPVKLYRKYISPAKGVPTCRFTPTCSAYAVEAVMEWGIVAGTVLAVWRIVRCNPFSKGGYDPVPRCPWRIRTENGEDDSRKPD